MNLTPSFSLTLVVALLSCHWSAGAQQVYRSVDQKGNVIYSDTPPIDAAETETVDLPPGPTEEQVKQAQQSTRDLKEAVDKLTSERQQREKIQAEKRREEQQRQQAADQEARLARLEAMRNNRNYWDYGAYYGYRPRPPIIVVPPIDRPEHFNPSPGLPPARGFDGAPLLKHGSSRF